MKVVRSCLVASRRNGQVVALLAGSCAIGVDISSDHGNTDTSALARKDVKPCEYGSTSGLCHVMAFAGHGSHFAEQGRRIV